MNRLLTVAVLALALMAPTPVPFARLVLDINTTASGASSFPSNFRGLNGVVYFTADDGSNGAELWRSDGTAAGTSLVYDIRPGPVPSNPGAFAMAGGVLVFAATDSRGRHVWRSDGTIGGTSLLKQFVTSPFSMLTVGNVAFSAAETAGTGVELWKTDGTEAGTVLVKDIWPGATTSAIANLTDVNGTLFFTATVVEGTTLARRLWKSDGTQAGTVQLGTAAGSPSNLVGLNGVLYFSAAGLEGTELWKSDGTPDGTVLQDTNPGPPSGRSDIVGASSLADGGRAVLFSATDGATGLELWKIDDRRDTVFLGEIASGPGSSTPEVFTRAGKFVIFTANDNTHGRELWALPLFAENLPQPAVDHIPTAAHGGRVRDGVPLFVYEQLETIENNLAADPDYPEPEP
jgi:trimeric autotransporter adhesin